jgi:hypothetical protein
MTSFTLTMIDKDTREKDSFSETLDLLRDLIPARYLNRPIPIFFHGALLARVESGVFSNTGVTLQCRFQSDAIQWQSGASARLMDGAYPVRARKSRAYPVNPDAAPDGIPSGILDGADQIPLGLPPLEVPSGTPMEARPAYLPFENEGAALARLDFEPVRSLRDHFVLILKGFTQTFNLDQTLDTADLFDFAQKGQQVLPLGDASIVLEGMQRQGSYIVLVAHGEDADGGRVEIQIEAELLARDLQNGEVSIAGTCASKKEGADILFYIGAQTGIRLTPDDIQLKIKRISVQNMEAAARIDLAALENTPSANLEQARLALEDAFNRRLAYQSGEITRSEITGFSEEILSDTGLMGSYTPSALPGKARYQSQTGLLSVERDHIQAALLERWEWECDDDPKSAGFFRAHRVRAVRDAAGGWIIQSDEIL